LELFVTAVTCCFAPYRALFCLCSPLVEFFRYCIDCVRCHSAVCRCLTSSCLGTQEWPQILRVRYGISENVLVTAVHHEGHLAGRMHRTHILVGHHQPSFSLLHPFSVSLKYPEVFCRIELVARRQSVALDTRLQVLK
jgi:hypothetical protein